MEMRGTVGSEHNPGEHPSVKSRKKEGTHEDERYWQVCKEKKAELQGRSDQSLKKSSRGRTEIFH